MEKITDNYQKRVEDINAYFELLELSTAEHSKLEANIFVQSETSDYFYNEEVKSQNITSLQKDILRANAIIILYNFIESTVSNSITTIYDVLNDNQIKYNDLIPELKQICINYHTFKYVENGIPNKTIIEKVFNLIGNIEEPISIEGETKLNGNLDKKKIVEISKKYVIELSEFHKECNNNNSSNSLEKIKKLRNNLAHGEVSFSEVGGKFSTRELIEDKDKIIKSLLAFVNCVQKYIEDKKYLHTPPAPSDNTNANTTV